MSGRKKTTTTTSQSNFYEPWVTAAGQDLFGSTRQNVENNPWQAYQGPTQGEFGQSWQDAQGFLSGMLGQENPQLTTAASGLQTIFQNIDPSKSVQDYMSPYIDQVLRPTLANINEAADMRNRGLAAEATMAGAYGDSAHGVQRGLQERDRMRAIGDATAGAYDHGWTQAAGLRQSELDNLFKTITGMKTIGDSQYGQSTDLAKILAGLGTQEQQANQTGIQNEISLNLQNQQMPQQQMLQLAQMLAMLPKNTSGTGTSTTSAPDNSALALISSFI